MDIVYLTIINHLIFNVSYYLTGIILFIIDYFKIFQQNKIQNKTNPMVYYKRILPLVLLNTLLLNLPVTAFFSWLESTNTIEFNWVKCLWDLFVGTILTDILFYLCHRILHIKYLYQKFHKKHHQIIAPVGMSAVYMNPVDLYFGNIIPVYLPLYLLGAHPLTMKLWCVITTVDTVLVAHSGFDGLSNFHDCHHSQFNKNYGINIFMDRICSTFYSVKQNFD